MERDDRRRLRESGIPLDTTGRMHAFSVGIGPSDGPMQLIPREKWPEEITAMAVEDSEFWKGRSISVRLIVELPFWLTLSDCEIPVVHDRTTIRASIRAQYMAVSDGPLFYDSQRNVVYIGPNDDLKAGKELPPVVAATRASIYRPMKTVVIFKSEAMEDAVLALQEPEPVTGQETRKIRRLNRAVQYLQSLAYAHLPLLNHLVTSYRIASRDPFAFQVSPWDVPVWFAEHNGRLARISLMPYRDADWYPVPGRFAGVDKSGFYGATADSIEAQLREDVAPGMLEVLEARSLLYRGRVEDAVRSAVTAIEVALEAQIRKLLAAKGWTEQQVETRMATTWNDFDERLADYERISGMRVPGPILSCIPYINGIRLKSELSGVRRLRHKIVHEGLRVDSHSRGPMLRAVETMTWLFYWLSWEPGKAQDTSRNYVFFEMMRGMHIPRYSVSYRDSGVVVLPDDPSDERVPTVSELSRLQYLATIDGKDSDIELFALMSFAYLRLDAEDATPPPDGAVVHERYYINYQGRYAAVFCLECDGVIPTNTIEAAASRLHEIQQHNPGVCSALCIINHQKNAAIRLREVQKAIPDDVNATANRCGVTLITAPDLRFLVQGAMEYKWDLERIKGIMFVPGRQGDEPPGYRRIGACVHFYGRPSVVSVDLQTGDHVETGMTLGMRLATRYHEERISSLQVNHEAVAAATGPCRVGIKTTLHRSDVEIGQAVFLRLV
jgi:hypothetical protein